MYVSGVSLGNPGPAGVGVVIVDNKSKAETSLAIGNADGNFATYYAILIAMENLKKEYGEETKVKHFNFKIDNHLVFEQLTKQREIKEPGLVPVFIAVHNHLVSSFLRATFVFGVEDEHTDVVALAKAALT